MPDEIMIMEFNDYQKKPVVVRAAKLDNDVWNRLSDNGSTMAVRGQRVSATIDPDGKRHFSVETLEGNMIANIDDMLIIGVKGEIYACKPDIFEQTYEKA